MTLSRKSSSRSLGSKAQQEEIEELPPRRDAYLENWPLLRDKSEDDLQALEKSLVRKLDYRFLPCITMMLLMKYVGGRESRSCFSLPLSSFRPRSLWCSGPRTMCFPVRKHVLPC